MGWRCRKFHAILEKMIGVDSEHSVFVQYSSAAFAEPLVLDAERGCGSTAAGACDAAALNFSLTDMRIYSVCEGK